MNYVLHILILVSIYLILSMSLNLLVGYVGLLSLSHAAFYGVGAYISTILMVELGLWFLPAMLLAATAATLISLVISIPALRLSRDYFVLASLAFQIITFTVLYNWVGLTGGPFGISNIPKPDLMGAEINSRASYFFFSGSIAATCTCLLYLIGHSPFGRALKAIREDEIAAATLGKNVHRFKINAFAISAGFAAIAGALFAAYARYIDPTGFNLMESTFILSLVIIGGAGNTRGPLSGTLLMIFLPEVLRFMLIPDSVAFNLRQIIYGALIILIMRYRPQGLFGEYRFQ